MHAVSQYQDGLKQLMMQLDNDERGCEAVSRKKKPLAIREKPSTRAEGRHQHVAKQSANTRPRVNGDTQIAKTAGLPRTVGLTELRSYLDNMLVEVQQLLKADLYMLRYWKSSEISELLLEKRNEHILSFRESLGLLERSMPPDDVAVRNHGVTGSKSIIGVIFQVKIAMIMLMTSVDCPAETNFDQFHGQFDEIVTRTEDLTNSLERQQVGMFDPVGGNATMHLGVSFPLFFVACKCRDWYLRRRAIKQLMRCGRDGTWEGSIMARVAQRVVEREERGLQPGQFVPEAARVHEVRKQVDHQSRTVRVEYRLAQDASWKHWTSIREVIRF